MVRRKWFLIGPVVVAIVSAGAVLSQLTPEYSATAAIVIGGTQPAKPETTAGAGAPETSVRVVSEVDLIQSASLLGQVVDRLALEHDPEFGAAPPRLAARAWSWGRAQLRQLLEQVGASGAASAPAAVSPRARAIALLTDAVSVTMRPPSSIVAVGVRSTDRAKAQRIADAITALYVADKGRARAETVRHAADFFADRLAALQRDAAAAEKAVAEFRATPAAAGIDTRATTTQTLSELSSQLNQARAVTAERESRVKALQRAQATPTARAGVTEILSNPVISSLQLQETEVARRVADLTQRYGEKYPRVAEARAELAQIRSRISAEIEKIVVSMEGDLDAARAKEAQIKGQVDRLQQQASNQGQTGDELRRLQQQADTARTAYREMLGRANEVQERLGLGQADVRVLSAASASEEPLYPRYSRTLYISALAGLVVGLLWIVIAERLDNGFRSGEQVERLTGRPLIGMIPLLRRSSVRGASPVKVVLEKRMSVYAEALRATQTAIHLGAGERKPKVIMVTSSVPGEGKSTFACSLAALAARSNPSQKIVLVDCDLRRATVGSLLGAKSAGGTIDGYLLGRCGLDKVFGRDPASGLYYVLSHTDTVDSAELLASASMQAFIEALAGQFDLVILDTPPLMAVSDPRIVAQYVDYVVFLVRWEKTERGLALSALKLLADARPDVGVVLSQIDLKRHARYGFTDYAASYSKYGGYYAS